MRDEQPDELNSHKAAGVANAVKNRRNIVGRQRDKAVWGRLRVVGPPRKERNLGTTVAVRGADGTRKLDAGATLSECDTTLIIKNAQITKGDVVLEGEGTLGLDDLVQAIVGVISPLNIDVRHDRTICRKVRL